MIIAVDFDGTIVSQDQPYDDLKSPLRFLPAAKEGLFALVRAGHVLVLYSARSNPSLWEDWQLDPILKTKPELFDKSRWLKSRELNRARRDQMMEFVRRELPGVFVCEYVGPGKPAHVDLFIDDRALGAGGVDWPRLVQIWGEAE